MGLGVVCCDAGAANQLLAFLKSQCTDDIVGYFSGPAKQIYPEFIPNVRVVNRIEDVVTSCDELISGTGWSSDIEHNARILASEAGVFSTAVLDHWVNYLDRFKRLDRIQLPDKIMVFDEIAFNQASLIFSEIDIQLTHPYYKDYILKKISKVKQKRGKILYICEPLRQASIGIYSLEQELLMNFLDRARNGVLGNFIEISIRLHPSENQSKYRDILDKSADLNVHFDQCALPSSIGSASVVVGYSSYALYLAYHAGRRVFSLVDGLDSEKIFDMNRIIPLESL